MKAIRFQRVVCAMVLFTAFAVAISGCSMEPTVKAQSPIAINSMLFGESNLGLAFNSPAQTTVFLQTSVGDPINTDVYSIPMPSHATLSHLHFASINNTLNSAVVTISVYVNGAPSMISCTVTAPGTMCSDTTHSVPVNEGDLVTIGMALTTASSANTGFLGPQWRASVGITFQ